MTYKGIADYLRCGWLVLVPLALLGNLAMYQLRDQNRLIVMSPAKTYHITEYSDQETLKRLYSGIVRDATNAFLMRNPNGLDEEPLFTLLFSGDARAIALKQQLSEAAQFREHSIHQKVELREIRIVRADKDRAYARVTGQLIRSYVGMRKKRTYTVEFNASYELTANYDLNHTVRFPFRVTGLKYQQFIADEKGEKK